LTHQLLLWLRRLAYSAKAAARQLYHLARQRRNESLLDGPIGERQKIHFSLEHAETGPAGESMWAEKVEHDCYKVLNNGAFVDAANGDIVRVVGRWPYLEVVEVVERARWTWMLYFDLHPSDDERRRIAEAVHARGGRAEWFSREALSVAVLRVDDVADVCRDILGIGVTLGEQLDD
jgi:Domain of unknown function (DUF4265)